MLTQEPAIFLFRIIGEELGWKANFIGEAAAHFSISEEISLRVTVLDQDPELAIGFTVELHLCLEDGSLDSSQLPRALIEALTLIRIPIDCGSLS